MNKRTKSLVKRIASTLAMGTLLLVNPVQAAEDPVFQLDQITVTAARVPQTVATAPGDVTVITGEQLEQKGARNLAEALEGVPGVVVLRNGGPGELAIPYILGTDRIVVLIDGKRMNLPQGIGSGAGGINLNNILLSDNIEKIEIVRGGGSVLYGADAVGGVVNIITKRGTGNVKTIVNSGFGSDATSRFNLSNQGSEKGWHWYITGLKEATEGQRPNSDYRGKNATLRLDRELNETEGLSFTYDYYGSHSGNPGNYLGSMQGINDYLRHNWSIGYSDKHGDGERVVRFYNNEHERTYYALPGMDKYFYKNKVRAIEYQDSAQIDYKNYLTWGSEWRKEVVSTAVYAPDTVRDRIIKAIYLQDQYKLNGRTSATMGMRYDDNSQYGAKWLPKIALAYKADNSTNYFANWGKVFKAPKFDDLYNWGGDPDLKPETGWTSEVGVKKRLAVDSEVTFSLFKRDLIDAIDWKQVGPDDWKVQNVHHLTTKGATLSFATKLTQAVSANIGYTYLDSRDENNNQQVPYNTFNLGIRLQQGKFSQEIYGKYVSKTSDVSSYFVWNTTFNYTMTKGQSLYLTISNLFNKHYQEVPGYPAQERAIFLGIKQSL
ncbi:TonB-dependent receptor [Thermosinus carboxydivorans Nor1]|uniref:TonB-dependent receptor n=1 Tax=Thermosinus carboxydivorans Nor1 TaxID=401526 RepID=A1HPP0_9FIRM|nr:TonB-dependent receptor [Thermosinus carboxydivorans]EAX48010.1 TonB-dependent receptor [Thermosinus carboxydivorans Nor1]